MKNNVYSFGKLFSLTSFFLFISLASIGQTAESNKTKPCRTMPLELTEKSYNSINSELNSGYSLDTVKILLIIPNKTQLQKMREWAITNEYLVSVKNNKLIDDKISNLLTITYSQVKFPLSEIYLFKDAVQQAIDQLEISTCLETLEFKTRKLN